jgi:serine/threonine protein kinase
MNSKSKDDSTEHQEKYSFLDQESNQLFCVKLDVNGEPIKLGDGTFGVVFEASNRLRDELAVKILYEYSAPGMSNGDSESSAGNDNIELTPDSIKNRFENEIDSTQKILELSEDKKLIRVIKVVGWTREFKKSNLYQELQSKFQGLKLSNYALVTEKYDCTLKTLLEGGIGLWTYSENEGNPSKSREELEQKSGQEKTIYELTGYDILRQKTFEDRIATILPYLIDIAQGLQTLHKAGLYHLDLKPANIFVKEDGDEVKSVIGDLGFLYVGEQPGFEALPVANLQLPLGTRHYRSPEQKDYFDICDVEVEVCNSNGIYDVKLITYDPKIRDSIIGDDDYVVFSKNKKAYPIKSIVIDNKNESYPIYITLNTKTNDLSNDKKTQIILYKRQTERTDLFGFGAILYDLLTCGESPERFYENIRVIYDKEDKNIKDIMEDYLKVSDFQSTEPSLVQVFESFKLNRNSSSYAPSDIVEIILQCMLYKAENTFYSLSKSNKNEEPKTAVTRLQESLLKLTDRYDGKYKLERIHNDIVRRNWNSAKYSPNVGFLDAIKNLQNLERSKLWQRFAQGYWFLEKTSRLVDDLLKSTNNFSFSELLPANFAISEKTSRGYRHPDDLNVKFKLYKSQESYERDLKSDFLYTKITRDIGNPFVPNYLSFMRRKINLRIYNDRDLKYQFLDSSPYGDFIEKDDWIIVKSKNSDNLLFQVENVEPNSNTILTLKLGSNVNSADDMKKHISGSNEDCIYYQCIDPCLYYFNMIGIYIYQIFFVGIDKNTQSKPYVTDFIKNEINKIKIKEPDSKIEIIISKILDKKDEKKSPNILWIWGQTTDNQNVDKDVENFSIILRKIVSIYLKLTFHESKDSYYANGNDSQSRIDLLFNDVEEIKKAITEAINEIKKRSKVEDNFINLRNYPESSFPFPPFEDKLQSLLCNPFNDLSLNMIEVRKT